MKVTLFLMSLTVVHQTCVITVLLTRFLSIIEKQCLRFTDVRFLNDSTEFLEIIPLIEHVLTNGNYSSSFKQFFCSHL